MGNKIEIKSRFYIICSVVVASVILILDTIFLYVAPISTKPDEIVYFKEIMYILITVCMYMHFRATHDVSITIHGALKQIFVSLLFITLVYFIYLASNFFEGPVFDAGDDGDTLVLNFNSVIGVNIITYTVLYYFTRIVYLMKILIYYKRKRNTAFFFRSFVLLMLATSMVFIVQGETIPFDLDNQNVFNLILFWATIFSLIVLALRNRWVTYLTRKEKWLYFMISLAVLVYFHFILYEQVLGQEFINIYVQSSLSYSLIYFTYYFLLAYTASSALNMLFHLPTARVFDRKMKEVQSLHNLSSAINSEPDFNKLVLMITNMANEVTEASSTWLEILDEKHDKLYIASSKKLTSNEIKTAKLSTSEGLSGKIFKQKKAAIINEISKDPEFSYIKSWKAGVNSLLAVPLITTKNKIMGIIFVAKNYEFGFEPDDLAMLQAFSNQVVIAIENSKLLKDSIQRERLEQELKIAKEVQQKLLPQEIPQIKGFDISAISFTANEVGGDYYDFISYDKNNFGVVVADVSGKGTSAAFYMAEMKGIIKSLSSIYKAPKDLFSHANEILFEQLEKKAFITASLVSIDSKKKEVRYIRAGHCPLIYYSHEKNELDYKTPKGIGLGLCNQKLFDMNLEEEKFSLKSGDIVVIYSDGLDEARNIFDEEYGEAKIGQLVVKSKDQNADDIKHSILDDIVAFTGKAPMHDDMTLAVIKVL